MTGVQTCALPICLSFITPDDGGRDLFVHFTGISGDGYRSLPEGSKVSYEEEAGPKGPKAVEVTKI